MNRINLLIGVVVSVLALSPAYAIVSCNDRLCTQDTRQDVHKAKHSKVVHVPARRYSTHQRKYRSDHVQRNYAHNSGSLTTVPTAAGIAITVSTAIADRMTSFISDMVAHGYKPHNIGCYASGGHVRFSRHYSGNACDFDGSLSMAPFFRTAEAEELIKQHGLHSGCDYVLHGVRDCGHVDDMTGFVHRAVSYVAHHKPNYVRFAHRHRVRTASNMGYVIGHQRN
jgi:hypothetical protein